MVKKINNSYREKHTKLAKNWKVISYGGLTLFEGELRKCYKFLYKNKMTEAILLAPGRYHV
jgi:hypothetical protein